MIKPFHAGVGSVSQSFRSWGQPAMGDKLHFLFLFINSKLVKESGYTTTAVGNSPWSRRMNYSPYCSGSETGKLGNVKPGSLEPNLESNEIPIHQNCHYCTEEKHIPNPCPVLFLSPGNLCEFPRPSSGTLSRFLRYFIFGLGLFARDEQEKRKINSFLAPFRVPLNTIIGCGS